MQAYEDSNELLKDEPTTSGLIQYPFSPPPEYANVKPKRVTDETMLQHDDVGSDVSCVPDRTGFVQLGNKEITKLL